MNQLESYLHAGWTISEAAHVLAHGVNNENGGYLLTLTDPSGHLVYETFVPRTTDVEELLNRQLVPM